MIQQKETIGSMLKKLSCAKEENRKKMLEDVCLTCVCHPESKLFEALIESAYNGNRKKSINTMLPPPDLANEDIKVERQGCSIVFSW